jgi:hypothetical protein
MWDIEACPENERPSTLRRMDRTIQLAHVLRFGAAPYSSCLANAGSIRLAAARWRFFMKCCPAGNTGMRLFLMQAKRPASWDDVHCRLPQPLECLPRHLPNDQINQEL